MKLSPLRSKRWNRSRRNLFQKKTCGGRRRISVGSFPLRIDTQSKLANFLAQVEYYGLGLDYPEKYPSLINSVTREGVLRVGKTYLHPEQVILVVVGNLKEAGMESPSSGP